MEPRMVPAWLNNCIQNYTKNRLAKCQLLGSKMVPKSGTKRVQKSLRNYIKCGPENDPILGPKIVRLVRDCQSLLASRSSPLEPDGLCNFKATGLEVNPLEPAAAKWTLKLQAFWTRDQSARACAKCNLSFQDHHFLSPSARARSSQTHM